jgi:stringent starvation protein B
MTSSRPYLLRAIYEWIIDNGMTPQLVVNAAAAGVEVPRQHVVEDKIILNIHPAAVKDLDLGKQSVSFSARFSGAPFQIFVPVGAVVAVYAKENGKGLVFNEEPDEKDDKPSGNRPGPHLTIVK